MRRFKMEDKEKVKLVIWGVCVRHLIRNDMNPRDPAFVQAMKTEIKTKLPEYTAEVELDEPEEAKALLQNPLDGYGDVYCYLKMLYCCTS